MTERYPVAYVEWVDSAILAGRWEDRQEVLGRVHHEEVLLTAGFLIDETPDGIVVAAALNPYLDDISSVVSIPRSAIRRVDLWAPWQSEAGS